jgi:hypothetical protein
MPQASLALTPALERILVEAFYPFHFLTADQVTRLLYSPGSQKGVQAHLKRLADASYLDRFPLPTGYHLQPYIYFLGSKGNKYIHDIRGLEIVTLPKLSVLQTRSHTFLMHLLEINNVLITATLLERCNPAVFLQSFEHDVTLKKEPFIATTTQGKKIEVVPDAVLDVRTRLLNSTMKRRRVLWIEVERGTNNDGSILKKLHGIYDVLYRRSFQERVSTPSIRVCYLTTAGEDDVERLRLLARKMLQERHGDHIHENHDDNLLFNFITIPAMGQGEIDVARTFLQSSWLHAFGDTERVPIIDTREV